ncbi:hypothetical protein [Paenibacillus sp. L3-i20]|uniref:DUF3846 domain-containing protein n=1 Tax=Paenibacillus sp. L3-i20 TaxID=2905833 RepID=UPI001EDDE927|nr:hypothetical protein [Paenibacillus sp. L3-i20]GKU76467.1 hypothetical protein L3i20_v208640 [Paenibacillus sp. L3-i20]
MAIIKVIVAEVGKEEIEVREIEIKANIYDALEEIADGDVESISIWNDVVLWLNLDVQGDSSAFNFNLTEKVQIRNIDEYEPKVSVSGNVVFTGTDADGEPVGLTEDEIAFIKSKFVNRQTYHQFTRK